MAELKGKSIIITGGASGIGEAAALLAARAGARVTVADLNRSLGDAVVKEIRTNGGEAQFVRMDIAEEAQVQAMVAAAVSSFGRLDGAFNNAGVPNAGLPLAELSFDAFRRNIGINLCGTFLCMKYEIAAMLKTGGGAIVNTSSNAGVLAIANGADYVSSKHGVIGLTKSGALDYATQNIRVNAVLPGVIRTAMMEVAFAANPQLVQWASDIQPNKRIGQSHEVAEAALWLLSDAASLVTGISMPVDGGYSMV